MTTRFCIVRHGETDWNVEKRIQGQIDIPLNHTGKAQALAMASNAGHHHFSAIYCSYLNRASETAHAISEHLGLAVKMRADLRERHYGIFQGITAEEGAATHPAAYAHYIARDLDFDFETGESLVSFAARVTNCLDDLARHHVGQSIALVSHAGFLDVLYRKATGRTLNAPRDFVIPNCALNWFRLDNHGLHLEVWADRHHLGHVLTNTPE